jgi:hypothetical protein
MIRTTSRSLRWCARGRFGRSGAPGFCPRSRRREIGGRAQAAPVVRGRPERPVRGGGGSCGTEVAESLLVLVSWGVQAAQVFTGVGGVAGHMHPAGGVASGDQFGRLAGMGDLAGAVGSSHSGQDRQADRAGQERQLRDDSGYDPAGTEPEGFRSFCRTVVVPGRTEHFLARPCEQRVVRHPRIHGHAATSRSPAGNHPRPRKVRNTVCHEHREELDVGRAL